MNAFWYCNSSLAHQVWGRYCGNQKVAFTIPALDYSVWLVFALYLIYAWIKCNYYFKTKLLQNLLIVIAWWRIGTLVTSTGCFTICLWFSALSWQNIQIYIAICYGHLCLYCVYYCAPDTEFLPYERRWT